MKLTNWCQIQLLILSNFRVSNFRVSNFNWFVYVWFTASHNYLLLLEASCFIWLSGSSNNLFPEVLERSIGCSCIEEQYVMCKSMRKIQPPPNQSCPESAAMRVDTEPVMGTHHTQVLYLVVAIRIYFKRLFPLLMVAKSLLSQWLSNSYLHLLNLEQLQMTDPSSDWWQRRIHHIYMVCLYFI